VIGVLAVFSRHSLSAEFLEVLQGLCTTLAIMLENALLLQRQPPLIPLSTQNFHPLSEQLDAILKSTRLSLIGTERPLTASATYILLQLTEILAEMNCTYCRLSYEAEQISLEAIVFLPEMPPSLEQDVAMLIASSQSTSQPNTPQLDALRFIPSQLNELLMAVTCLGGTLQTLTGVYQNALQVVLRLPYPTCRYAPWLRIHCTSPILQAAFTTLAHQAGLNIYSRINHPLDLSLPLLTDDLTQIQTAQRVLWLGSETAPVQEIMAIVDVNMTPGQLREAVEAVARGETWGDVAASSSKIISSAKSPQTRLSEREREILQLLAHGLRDRDIANQLHISERTVKFHMNNVLTKVKARTRAQAIYLSTLWGWLDS
jgi:DNA-binding CsgD family transcriptional regulator